MNVYCLYFPNGKRYVGTEARTGRRINDHANVASIRDKGKDQAQVVHLAIQKHGWENCQWRYLATNCTKADAYALEVTFICLFRTQDPEWGYNRSVGGEDGGLGVKRSARSLARLRETLKQKDYVPTHLHTPEVRAKAVATRKREGTYGPPPAAFVNTKPNSTSFKTGGRPWNEGKPMSEEARGRLSETKKRLIALPGGPNGETRYYRPERLI